MTAKCPEKAAAKAAGLKRYISLTPCPKGHGFERLTASGNCTECNRALRRAGYHRSPTQKMNAREAMRLRRVMHFADVRTKEVRVKLKSQYGITGEQYAQMFSKQEGCCAICGLVIFSRLDPYRHTWQGHGAPVNEIGRVDHCHSTGAVRGLLCSNCNIGLGKFWDDEKNLLNAVGYLRASATLQAQPTAGRKTASEIEPGNRDLDSNVSRENRRSELSPFLT